MSQCLHDDQNPIENKQSSLYNHCCECERSGNDTLAIITCILSISTMCCLFIYTINRPMMIDK